MPNAIALAVLSMASLAMLAPPVDRIAPPNVAVPTTAPSWRVLLFSKTSGFRHDSIPAGIKAITELGTTHGFEVDATEDAAQFQPHVLARYRVVVFLNTTGDVLDESQQQSFERFIQKGGGYVGVHAASDTEYDWPWYTRLVGAQFASHPHIQPAAVDVVDREHVSTSHLPQRWSRTDEWYNFRDQPERVAGGRLRVLAKLDESTYEGGSMAGEHPIVWCQEYDGGRAWYTAMGHTIESYDEPEFRTMLLGGVRWAGRAHVEPGSTP